MTEQKSMRIEEALTLMATSAARTADALERLVALGEAQRNDVGAMRQQIEETFIKLTRELQAMTPAVAEAAALVEQAVEEKSDESEEEEEDEGQRPMPVADEAPAKPEAAGVKQEKKEEPAAPAKTESAKTEEKPAAAPAPKAEQAAPLPIEDFQNKFRALKHKYAVSNELNMRVQKDIAEELGLSRLTACKPQQRQYILEAYEARVSRAGE